MIYFLRNAPPSLRIAIMLFATTLGMLSWVIWDPPVAEQSATGRIRKACALNAAPSPEAQRDCYARGVAARGIALF
jgi:hypothetical protein